MNEFSEQDHIEMLEREVVYWKGQMQKAGEELAQALPRLTIFENATVKKVGEITELKKGLRDRDEAYGDLKLQLIDSNDKHSEEMKGMYKKLNNMEKHYIYAAERVLQVQEVVDMYKDKLDFSNQGWHESTKETERLNDLLSNVTRQKRHILRAFNDKAKELSDLKHMVKQLERENSSLSETVNMLSSKQMGENRILRRACR